MTKSGSLYATINDHSQYLKMVLSCRSHLDSPPESPSSPTVESLTNPAQFSCPRYMLYSLNFSAPPLNANTFFPALKMKVMSHSTVENHLVLLGKTEKYIGSAQLIVVYIIIIETLIQGDEVEEDEVG